MASIADVIAVMRSVDGLLPSNDGLKWFNRLYLMVTQQINAQPPPNGWEDATWPTRLDIVFAKFYFAAIVGALEQNADTASSWDALFEARARAGVDRIQFALAGMNAHINHDLALALLQTDDQLHLAPALPSPEHDDYEHVNGLLEEVLPSALNFLATGIVGELAQDTGTAGRLLAIWNVRAARDLAWDFADHLRNLGGVSRDLALEGQDKLTGVIGRSLLLPLSEQGSSHAETKIGACAGTGSNNRNFSVPGAVRRGIGIVVNARPYGVHPCPRMPEFLSTLQTDVVGPLLDREHTAQSAVMTTEGNLENPKQEFHKSCVCCRRSQLPLASNHSRRECTLARASAIEQSAAP